MTGVTAVALFADDVRIEQSGKFMLIGVYHADITFPPVDIQQFPLYAHMIVRGPASTNVEYLIVQLSLDGEVFMRFEIPREQAVEMMKNHQSDLEVIRDIEGDLSAIDDILLIQAPFYALVPFSKEKGLLRAEIDIGRGLMSAGTIPLRKIQVPSSN